VKRSYSLLSFPYPIPFLMKGTAWPSVRCRAAAILTIAPLHPALERSNLPGMPTKAKPVSKSAQKPPKSKAASLVVSSNYPERPRGELLVGRGLRPADALRTADRPALPQQDEQARQDGRQRRRLDRSLLRPARNAPKGKEANWTETVPGKGWFTLFRVYGPLEPWFDRM
jgi:hypothetical protein